MISKARPGAVRTTNGAARAWARENSDGAGLDATQSPHGRASRRGLGGADAAHPADRSLNGTLALFGRTHSMARARILIVEDEYLVAADLEAALEERGYSSVGIAPDAEEALRLASRKPDLALVDIHLRDGQTGTQIAERLVREHGIAVLFVTANPRMTWSAKGSGVIGVLSKPCQEEVVVSAIDYALEARSGASLPSPPVGLMLLDDVP